VQLATGKSFVPVREQADELPEFLCGDLVRILGTLALSECQNFHGIDADARTSQKRQGAGH
jgi:hypothetical protein